MAATSSESRPFLLKTDQVAEHLNVKPITLRKWRLIGRGPKFIRCGSSIRYHPEQIAQWIERSTVVSTSAPEHDDVTESWPMGVSQRLISANSKLEKRRQD